MASTPWLTANNALAMIDYINDSPYQNALLAERALVEDGAVSSITVGGNNQYENAPLRVFGFGVDSAVPAGATITGIELAISRFADPPSTYVTAASDSLIRLVLHGGSQTYRSMNMSSGATVETGILDQRGTNLASSILWPQSQAAKATATYGGPTMLWDAGLTEAQIRSPTLGVDILPAGGGKSAIVGYVDSVKMRVYYEGGAEPEPSPTVSSNPAPCPVVITSRAASTSATRSFTAATKRRSVVLTRRTPTTSAARSFSANPTSAPLSLTTQSATATASQVIAQTITCPSTLNVGSYSGNYEVARAGAGLTTGIYGWVGQYFTGSSYEISQVFLGFDLSAVPNREITKAELRFTVNEAYGVNTVEARQHDWQDANSFVAGADLASKPLLGSTSVSAGQTGAKVISLTGVTRSSLLKIVLAGADQRTGTPPVGDDTTLLLSAGASLYLEFGDEIQSVDALASPLPASIEITRSAPSASFTAAYVATPSSTSLALQGGLGSARASILSAPTAAILSLGSKGVSINSAALAGALRGNLSIVSQSPAIGAGSTTNPSRVAVSLTGGVLNANASTTAIPSSASVAMTPMAAVTTGQRNLSANPSPGVLGLLAQIGAAASSAVSTLLAGSVGLAGGLVSASSSTANETKPQPGSIVSMGSGVSTAAGSRATASTGSLSVIGQPIASNASTNAGASPLRAVVVLTGAVVVAGASTDVASYPQRAGLGITGREVATFATRSFDALVRFATLKLTGHSPQVLATTNVQAEPQVSALLVNGSDAGARSSSDALTQAGRVEFVGLLVEAAATVSPVVPITPTPERTIVIPAEDRLVRVAAESRLVIAQGEIRLVKVSPESRLITVPAESRTVNTAAEKRLLVATS